MDLHFPEPDLDRLIFGFEACLGAMALDTFAE